MNKSSDPNGGYVSSELLPGKKFESLTGQHPSAARRGAEQSAECCRSVHRRLDSFRYTYMQARPTFQRNGRAGA